jgi:pimeloyl-ACP methyl ester carboxylesterase
VATQDDPQTVTAVTALTRMVQAEEGNTYAYRKVGQGRPGARTVVMLNHFRGVLDQWDPLLIDTVAASREVVLVDLSGVGRSTGSVPRTVREMARDAIAFIDALGLKSIDLVGHSIGGMIAQEVTLLRPWVIHRLVLASTGPRGGGIGMHGWADDIAELAQAPQNTADDLLRLFFAPTETSKQRGREYLGRMSERKHDTDEAMGPEQWKAQYDAVVEWGIPDPSQLARLAGIRQPTLVASGDNDTMIPTENAWVLSRHLPNARVRIFPDSGHGFLYEWPVEFGELINQFLG